ncbi:response regulator [Rhizobium sp. BG4]|uniref:response regulator n=1 Tax=Rhizobium sp. BG4 TaxID=2613770 RepID=UPI0032B1C9ED
MTLTRGGGASLGMEGNVDQKLSLLTGKNILIVEDEYFVADDVRQALEWAGACVVGPAPSVEAGMVLIDTRAIDGAILDIRLDGETVFPIAERLQTMGIPFVFATAYIRSQIPDRYVGYHLCEKPTELGAIAVALFGTARGDH